MEKALNNTSSNGDLLFVNSSFGADALHLNDNGECFETSSSILNSSINENGIADDSILSVAINYLIVKIEA